MSTTTIKPSPLNIPNRVHTCMRIQPKGYETGWIVLNGCNLPHRGDYREYDMRAGKTLYKEGGIGRAEAFYMAMSRMKPGQWATQWYSFGEQVECKSCKSRNGEEFSISSYVKVYDEDYGAAFAVGFCEKCNDLRILNH